MTPTFATVIHKFIRSEMFGVSLALSTCDANDASALAEAVARLERVANLLRTHADKEDEAFLSVLQAREPEAAARMKRDHEALEARLEGVLRSAASLSSTPHALRVSALLLLYLDWNSFLSAYFAHLDDEECALFPMLGDALPGVAAMAAAAAQFPPEARAGFLDALWRALAPGERAAIEEAMAGQTVTAA